MKSPATSFHDDLGSRPARVQAGSDRAFGFWFALLFGIIAVWPLRHGRPLRVFPLAVGGVFAAVATLLPHILGPLNRAWHRFSLLLSRIVTPITMAILFFVVFVPGGFLLRLFGKTPLAVEYEPGRDSYWSMRAADGTVRSMLKQF